MRIAVEGCAHGELEKIYDTIAFIEQQENYKVDLLLCCGDFQATRNLNDLDCMAVPKKFQDICTFYKYYSGEKVAPIFTIFIGGNHEASNYLQELPYGGWVAPNIFYLGYAGVVNFKGIRIGGLSGIYKGYNFFKGHFEYPPYDANTIRSVYHYRQQEVFRLRQLAEPIDIMMSHDWPTEVYNHGNAGQLIRFKPHFRDEIHDNKLGSPPCFELLKKLKPTYWFSGHLHCKFAAVIPHEGDSEKTTTKFLALDKCLPNRRFLQIIDIEAPCEDGPNQLQYDLEWLTILYTTKHLTHVKATTNYMPGEGNATCRWDFKPTAEEKEMVLRRLDGNLIIPRNFERTAPPYDRNSQQQSYKKQQPKPTQNPQTIAFCNLLDIDDPLNLVVILSGSELNRFEYRDTANAPISDSSFNLNESDKIDEVSETTLNSSIESSSCDTGLTMLKQRLSLFDSLPAPKNNESGNPEEKVLDLSDVDEEGEEEVIVPQTLDYNIVDDQMIPIGKANDATANEPITEIKIIEKRDGDEIPMIISPNTKKFKRRNASIYNAESED